MSDHLPDTVQPWLLLGERRRRLLEDRLREAAERWSVHWIAGSVTVSVVIEPAGRNSILEHVDRKPVRFGVRGTSGEWLAELLVPPRLAAWAAGLGAVELSAIADLDDVSPFGEIELALVLGYWDMLIPREPAVDASLECLDEQQADEARLALAKRGVRAACIFGPAPGLSIQATLSPTIVATLLAERRVGFVGESLISRRSALAPASVSLDCCLGSVQVPLRDLHSLRIGDVLVTDIALDGHAELRVRGRPRPMSMGTLGEVGGRKAIKVETAQVVSANKGLRA